MATWTQKKLVWTIGGGAFAVCALAVGGVFYAQGLIDEVRTQIDQKQQEIAAAQQKIDKIPELEKDVIILRENLEEYVKILPDSKELVAFVRMLDQFERQSGIQGTGLVQRAARQGKKDERFTPIEYTYEMQATLWEFLKFVNLIENYERFVNVAEYSIQSGAKGRTGELRDGEVVHNIRLQLQTYTYNAKASGKEVQIPDYEKRKDALREQIFKSIVQIQFEKWQHKGQMGRRDIFVDPRMRGEDLKGDGTRMSLEDEKALIKRYGTEVANLVQMLQRLRKQDTTLFEQYALEKALREGMQKLAGEIEHEGGRLGYALHRLRWAKEVVGPFDDLRTQLDQVGQNDPRRADPYLPQAEIESLLAAMRDDLNAGQLEQAKERYDTVAAKLNVPSGDPRHELAVAAKKLQVKASIAIDFKNLDLRLQGVVVNHGGRSGVLLNGETYEEGEYVSEELLVKTVEEEQVWFVFRGLTLVRTM